MARTTDTVVGQVLPGGGDPGAILTKASAANGDAIWSQPALPTPIPPAPGSVVNNTTVVYVNEQPVPASQLIPLSTACLGRWEADFGINVADGAPAPSWAPAQGLITLADPGGVVTPPTFRAEDAGDNTPWLDFDGASNGLGKFQNFAPAYGGTDLTYYLVANSLIGIGTGNMFLATLNRNGVVAGVAAGTFGLRAHIGQLSHNAAVLNNAIGATSAGGVETAKWTTFVFRVSTILGRQYAHFWIGSWCRAIDLTALGGLIWNIDGINLGYNGDGPVFGGNFNRCGIRHLSVYTVAHRDDQVNYMGHYLSRYGQAALGA